MQNEELLTVRDILDDDYGCKELPLGAEPMVTVILTDDHGAERSLRLADSQTRTWRPGDRITLGEDGVPLRAGTESHGGT